MGTLGSYFLNGPTLATSTGIFTDINFSTCAPDGFYSQGGNVRQLLNCVLLPFQKCPTCATDCHPFDEIDGQGSVTALYTIPIYLGELTGACRVQFEPGGIPDGIRIDYAGAVFNRFSAFSDGYHGTTVTNGFTYMGQQSQDCGLVATGAYTLAEREYYDGNFISTGSSTTVNIVAGSVSLSPSLPKECITYIPKTTAGNTTLTVEIAQCCPGQPAPSWSLQVQCPSLLFPVEISSPNKDCDSPQVFVNEMFIGPVAGTANAPKANDWAYLNAFATQIYPPGRYLIRAGGTDLYEINIGPFGVITDSVQCP